MGHSGFHTPFWHGVNAIGSRPLSLGSIAWGWRLTGRSEPMNTMDTVHHCGCCGLFCAVLLDVGICPTKATIIYGTNFVSFINGRHGPRAKFTRETPTYLCCLLLGERAFHQTHGFFFNECLFDGIWEGFSWVIVVAACRWREVFPIIWTSSEFFLRGPHSRRCQSRFIHPNRNPLLECEWVFPIWITRGLRQPWDQSQEKGLPLGNSIFWCGPKTLSNIPECDIGEWVILFPTGDRHLYCLVEFWCDVNDLLSQGCDPCALPQWRNQSSCRRFPPPISEGSGSKTKLDYHMLSHKWDTVCQRHKRSACPPHGPYASLAVGKAAHLWHLGVGVSNPP